MYKLTGYKKELFDLILHASRTHDVRTIFTDFLELSALSISNSVDKVHFKERESLYIQIVKKYNKQEVEIFSKMLSCLVLALEEKTSDVLGEVSNALELSNKRIGQFFTPYSVSQFMGMINVADIQTVIDKKGFVRVNEPCVGSGSLVIGFCTAMKSQGYNYQQQMVATCVDLDIKAVHMAYLQLSILGVPAIIMHGNSLINKIFSYWYTPFYILFEWPAKLELYDTFEKIKSIIFKK